MKTDTELLERFVSHADEAAFRALVVRHGPSVQRVCRSVLGDVNEADDAFQATFLVFMRKAVKVDDPELLGSWLRGVAYKVSVHARRDQGRRRQHESKRFAMRGISEIPDASREEQARILREELAKLPDCYRAALSLCYLEGLSHEDASGHLGWPLGTVKARLVRGRRLLRDRLDRRGVTLGAALFLFLTRPTRSDAVSASLVDSTVEAMVVHASGVPRLVAARFPRPHTLSTRVDRSIWVLPCVPVVFVALTLAVSGACEGVSRHVLFHGQPSIRASLPGNLTDVLNVDCR